MSAHCRQPHSTWRLHPLSHSRQQLGHWHPSARGHEPRFIGGCALRTCRLVALRHPQFNKSLSFVFHQPVAASHTPADGCAFRTCQPVAHHHSLVDDFPLSRQRPVDIHRNCIDGSALWACLPMATSHAPLLVAPSSTSVGSWPFTTSLVDSLRDNLRSTSQAPVCHEAFSFSCMAVLHPATLRPAKPSHVQLMSCFHKHKTNFIQ